MNYRLFIAVNLPADTKNQLAEEILNLQKIYNQLPLKWVEPNNLHLTLHFLGKQDDLALTEIKNVLANETPKFPFLNLSLGNYGVFPNLDQPRVIYLELKEEVKKYLKDLQSNLGQKLAASGFEIDHRPWQPHITLARVKTHCRLALPSTKLTPAKFKIATIDLMQSELYPAGPVYSLIQSFPLKNI
jgi:2'-5' RNA ligase